MFLCFGGDFYTGSDANCSDIRMNHISAMAVYLSECTLFNEKTLVSFSIHAPTHSSLGKTSSIRISSFIVMGDTHTSFLHFFSSPTLIISPSVWRREGFSKVVRMSQCSDWDAFHTEHKRITCSYIYFLSYLQPFHHLVPWWLLLLTYLPVAQCSGGYIFTFDGTWLFKSPFPAFKLKLVNLHSDTSPLWQCKWGLCFCHSVFCLERLKTEFLEWAWQEHWHSWTRGPSFFWSFDNA